ncbi:high-potential iron-sulfur protein [Parendozoicomonas haliclonae]|uniref:High-potential iron-sulfur protein n=1 Tax=Parendozoicomonas haliclonae TaxID=1960125 RepID=A0A1X7ARS8_9GAMM|nr:high-potential iron-sulfur protein [Parendozoicomonas haliclonae]SMA50853.1 High-potential iron-sulfur protein [Parendozoicomonas haliclonae]
MSSQHDHPRGAKSRRQFLKLASGIALIPLVNISSVSAEDKKLIPLMESDPQAQALKYVATQEKAQSMPGYKAGSKCDNCLHFVAGTNGCNIFPGRSVDPDGWCAVWAPKPS